MDKPQILARIIELLSEVGEFAPQDLNADSVLIGRQAIIKSRVLVELLLAVEEFAEDDLAVKFDWTSDAAMSEIRSVFRTVGTLADHLYGLTASG